MFIDEFASLFVESRPDLWKKEKSQSKSKQTEKTEVKTDKISKNRFKDKRD